MGTEDRVGRVFHVPLRVVGELGRNLLLIAAGLVPPQGAGQAAPPSGVGGDLPPIFPQAITDMKITLVAGRAHNKHTEGGDFRQATYRAALAMVSR